MMCLTAFERRPAPCIKSKHLEYGLHLHEHCLQSFEQSCDFDKHHVSYVITRSMTLLPDVITELLMALRTVHMLTAGLRSQ